MWIYLHFGQLFILAWLVILVVVLISMQKKAEREMKAVMDVLISIIKNLPESSFKFDPKSPLEFKTIPAFIYGKGRGDFRPMGEDRNQAPPLEGKYICCQCDKAIDDPVGYETDRGDFRCCSKECLKIYTKRRINNEGT